MPQSIITEIEIEAPIETVWKQLTDFERHPDWNPFIASLKGRPAVGARLEVVLGAGESKSRFTPKVLEWEPPRRFVWEGSLPIPGLFVGRHEFILTEMSADLTHLLHQEFFRGLLSGWLLRKIGQQTRAGFIQMNEALKHRCEAAC